MSTLLYRTMYEYSRVVETITLTEDGAYVKDKMPEGYGGSFMNVEIVHRVTMMDMSGYIEVLNFENPVPKSQNDATTSGKIMLDGVEILVGDAGSDARTWTTRLNANAAIPEAMKTSAKNREALAKKDKEATGGSIL